MAWNEPGGNGNKPRDPWGGGDQGPPDMDEAMRKLKQQLAGIFGGGGGGGSSKGLSGALFLTLLSILVVVWALMGFYTVDEQERGVVLRLGKYHTTVQPGLQWNPPLVDDVTVVNVTRVNTAAFREQMLTQDENIVEVDLSVQYVIDNAENYVLRVRGPERSLTNATESSLRHVVGDNTMDYVLTDGRVQLAFDVRERLQNYLDAYETGITVSTVNIDDAKPPAEVQEAFDDVIKAREDEERVKNEAQAYANQIIPEARGQAQRVIEEANAYKEQVIAEAEGDASRFTALREEYAKAPEVTRQRLYLDTVQGVMENTSKVVVDVEGGNNLLYLPLDKLVEQGNLIPSGNAGSGAVDIRELTDRVVDQLRRDNAARSSSSRGGR
ncbi:MAG: FtsH protease activity modulator HflK [Halieaceae bacterium]|jgi:membrane protease subunit HflK|nr:FtsH protease activity modulator HflK [Halieaceae bacterium]